MVDIITMGCSKNLVDSERLIRLFAAEGLRCAHNPEHHHGQAAVVNTCGFIDAAKEESINMILFLAEEKKAGRLKNLFVMGCLSQRYQKELEKELPQVDKFYGKFNWKQLARDLDIKSRRQTPAAITRTTPRHYAYLKISEGCDRQCAYCAIPLMTGRHKSRAGKDILEEVKMRVGEGVKEFQVIAQELTYYGVDIDGGRHIAELINDIADVKGVEWIRLHYAYPAHFPLDLLDVMRERSNVCKYLDIAIQHISDNILSRMHRHITGAETYALIKEIRRRVPGIYLRTTLMVGFPGETDDDFRELKDFVREIRFERMGAFAYSEEEGTFSADHYKNDVPEKVKEQRLDELMAIQQDISREMEEDKIGRSVKVIVDREEDGYYIARSQFSSPEIDPEILIPATKRLFPGRFYNARITSSEVFDLYAETI